MFIRHFSSRAFPFISLFFLSPIGPLPGSSPSHPSHTLSAEGDTSPVTEVNGALVSWRPCHQLSGRSHWTKHHILQQTTWILFSHCALLASLLCQPDRMRTHVYLYDLCLLLTHPCHWTHVEKSTSNTLTFVRCLPSWCHGKIQRERKLKFIFILATKTSVTLSKAFFSIFCFMRILDSVSEPRTFSPSIIYQGALWWRRPHALFLFSQKDLFPTSFSISKLSLLSVCVFVFIKNTSYSS